MNNKHNSNIHNRRREARERWGFAEAKEQTRKDVATLVKLGAVVVTTGAIVAPIGMDAFNDNQEKVEQDHRDEYGVGPLGEPSATVVEVDLPPVPTNPIP